MRSMKILNLVIAVGIAGLGCICCGAGITVDYAPLSPELVSVPQNLLSLIHTREVQTELAFSPEQLSSWEKTLREIDARWWPSRILPASDQRKSVAELEVKMMVELESLLGPDAVRRLRQIELQSQSGRTLARPEVAKFLGLDAKQAKKLSELFAETDQLAADSVSKNAKENDDKVQALIAVKQAEPKKARAILTPAQAEKLKTFFGKPFETSKLERIYPFAPELISSGFWTNERQPKLETLLGQVVLVHFYAFQCHNCVANFNHYKRWDSTLKAKGVQVIGIQTPETSSEKDPEKVRSAAAKEGFQFPVLIDVENKNWSAWGNTMWPTVYVVDKQGYIRFWWQGELNWQGATVDKKVDAIIEKLLNES